MSGQKFFHGLTEAMINRSSERPDRQKSNFYWPDEYLQDAEETFRTSSSTSASTSRRQSTTSSSTATPLECTSPVNEADGTGETAALKQRHRSNARSHIEFYDDCDSSFSQIEKERQREKLRIEKFLREQEDDVSGAAKSRRQSTLKSNFQFYDFVDSTPPRASPIKKQIQNNNNNNGYHPAITPDINKDQDDRRDSEQMSQRFSPTSSTPITNGNGDRYRRQLSSPASSEYHYSARYTGSYEDFEDDCDRYSLKSNDFNFSPPGTPSVNGDVPEHKRLSQRHLRSSINFCNGVAVADDSSAPRKPASVRDSAATQRVGVGLPNL